MEKYNPDLDSTTPGGSLRDRKISRLLRRSLVTTCICLAIYLLFHRTHVPSKYVHDMENVWKRPSPASSDMGGGTSVLPTSAVFGDDEQDGTSTITESNRVPLEAHIMSKCPDARDCLQRLIVPAMEKISDKVNFRLSFIGRLKPRHVYSCSTFGLNMHKRAQ